ncbi:sn-glycerol-3-phosphate ABC transporter ATP-binding protein UgpC [bacterium]|nr:sn-glycerol-3-phosphate ABC transporter ATP-binding protein UgpC [bacterium]
MAAITLKGLGKSYGSGYAVEGVDLTIADGEFVVLVGPSGCGKSTLLRMIAGLETVTKGDILIGERRVNDVEPAERDIAMVFQNYALYPHMSVRQNLSYGLKNRGMSKAEIDTRITKAAETLELGAYLDRKPRALSGGQRQRVAMGRAIVREPQAFLFDEPLSNLDAKLRVTMRSEIRQLQRRLGTTSVYVTHDQVEAMTLADRLVVLNAGRIEQIGSPLEVYTHPASAFVASFIGAPAMNLLPVRLMSGALAMGDQRIDLPPGLLPPGLPEGAGLLLGIRPEAAVLADTGLGFDIAVSHVEELGAARIVYGQVGGQSLVVQVQAGQDIAPQMRVSFPAAALRLFRADTGKALT